MASKEIHETTIKQYLVLLQQAHAALNAIEKTCLKGRTLDASISDEDWRCIRSTYDAVMQQRGGPPMSGNEC